MDLPKIPATYISTSVIESQYIEIFHHIARKLPCHLVDIATSSWHVAGKLPAQVDKLPLMGGTGDHELSS